MHLCVFGTLAVLSYSDAQVRDVHATHAAFKTFVRSFYKYRQFINRIAPDYSPESRPGPPFDMFYHLECLHRDSVNISSQLHESERSWDELTSTGHVESAAR